MQMSKPQTPGREANAAQPLGDRKGLVSDKGTKRTAEKEQRSAGPDGPDAGVIGATFKK
jgi:hypothetical protein